MQALWNVPRSWPDSRCFILCGGESINQQLSLIPKLPHPIIAVKHGVLLRPDADVLFVSGEFCAPITLPLIPLFHGEHMVIRGKGTNALPDTFKRVTRAKDHTKLCDLSDHVSGYDTGTSAINLAYHFGSREIVLLGYDMQGGRWFNGQWPHPQPKPHREVFERHMSPLVALNHDARSKGVKILNASTMTAVKAFERVALADLL